MWYSYNSIYFIKVAYGHVPSGICGQRSPNPPAHARSLIRAFHVRQQITGYYKMYEWRAKARMKLCACAWWYECAFCAFKSTFSLGAAHIVISAFCDVHFVCYNCCNCIICMSSRKHAYIILTPWTPLLYSKTGVYRGIHYFSYYCIKHRLWVLVRTASPRRFYRVPTIYVLSRNMKNIRVFYLKIFSFFGGEIFHIYRRVFIMCNRGENEKRMANIVAQKSLSILFFCLFIFASANILTY